MIIEWKQSSVDCCMTDAPDTARDLLASFVAACACLMRPAPTPASAAAAAVAAGTGDDDDDDCDQENTAG